MHAHWGGRKKKLAGLESFFTGEYEEVPESKNNAFRETVLPLPALARLKRDRLVRRCEKGGGEKKK